MRLNLVPALVALAAAAVHGSTLTPPVLPLFVRNPYLSFWFPDARGNPWEHWPIFWTGSTVGFSIMASVPETGSVYPLLGRPQDSLHGGSSRFHVTFPHYTGASFDASTTNLTYTIQETDIKITLSFLSPITPTSTLRQSFPASYLNCHVEGSSDVSLYIDINGEWISGKGESKIEWNFAKTKPEKSSAAALKTWRITRQDSEFLSEFQDRAEWGTIHLTGPADVEHQSGEAKLIRRQFAEFGNLRNHIDDAFRGIFEDEPLFAFSKTFKLKNSANTAQTDSALFTFALTQDTVAQFAAARGLTLMRPLWGSYFFTAEEMLQYHYDDYLTAAHLASDYSTQLSKDAYASGSQDYQDIVAISARQVIGGTVFSGTPDKPILFLKEISSDGNFQTIDVIFPAFPFFLYTNPKWLEHLLEPLIEHQLSGQYPNEYSMHDLGSSFPNATGHSDGNDEYMPVEECGNMLIMGLALANAIRDNPQPAFARDAPTQAIALEAGPEKRPENVDAYGIDKELADVGMAREKYARKWASHSYKLWKQWTGYLVRESLIPANQLSTDDFAGWLANQTNLALKGIVGIKAMGGLADLVGEEDDARYYRKVADEYIEKWQEYGISRDKTHAKLAYRWFGSWTTIYNLYGDALLCFHLPNKTSTLGHSRFWDADQVSLDDENETSQSSHFIPDAVYKMQSDWYHAVLQKYGLPLDSRHLYTKSDWQFFAAAVTSKKVRTEILQSVARWVNETTTDRPFTDLYQTEGEGGWPGPRFKARPVVGGHFAFLALERACNGKAVEGLQFLDETDVVEMNVEELLMADMVDNRQTTADEL